MVKSLSIFAIMAGLAIAAPMADILEARHYATTVSSSAYPVATSKATGPTVSIPFINLGIGALPLVSLSTGFSMNVGMALGACSKGVSAGVVSPTAKAALSVWISGAGKAYFPASTCASIKAWATGSATMVLNTADIAAIELSLLGQSVVSSAGNVLSFLNGVVTAELGGASKCACSALGAVDIQTLSVFITANTAKLSADVLGAMKLASCGGLAVALSPEALASLTAYLALPTISMDAGLKATLLGWTAVGGKVTGGSGVGVTIGSGSTGSTGLNVVLSTPAVASLNAFIGSAAFAPLSASIKSGLHSCANGGLSTSLIPEVSAALTAFLASPTCALTGDLKITVLAWMNGTMAVGLQIAPVTAAVSIPAVVLTAPTAVSLTTFCGTSAFLDLALPIQAAIKSCAAGGASVALSGATKAALSIYLSSITCTLPADLKATVTAWLGGLTGTGLVVAPTVSAAVAPIVSLGMTINANVNMTGALVATAQTSLLNFCSGSKGLALDVTVLGAMKAIGAGQLAVELSTIEVEALTGYLVSAECALTAEMKGTIALALSMGVTGLQTAHAGVGMGAGAGFALGADAISTVSAALHSAVGMTAAVKAAVNVAISGVVSDVLSMTAKAELTAFCLAGEAATGLSAEITGLLTAWVAGTKSDCGCA